VRALAGVLPGRDVAGATLTTLAHKPQRRWVGRVTPTSGDPVVLRVHRPAEARATIAVARALEDRDPQAPRLPRLAGTDPDHGMVALSWLPGEPLHALLAAGTARSEHLWSTGAALAALHARPPGDLPVRSALDDARDVRRAAAAVGELLPGLGARAAALADRLADALAEPRAPVVTVHGDFSADQVVIDAAGTAGLVDLDAVGAGEAEADLAGAVAALHSAAVRDAAAGGDIDGTVDALRAGYRRHVDERRLRLHTAAGLLRRAVDPFRRCRPRWPEEVAELVERAEAAEADRLGRRGPAGAVRGTSVEGGR
jgi:Ser/Thr protein kinase RdoA (MazF antagonist)